MKLLDGRSARPTPDLIFPSLIMKRARTDAHRTFLQEVGGESFTYRQTAELISDLAEGLRDNGVVAGDRVASMVTNSADSVIIMGAIGVVGAIHTPINTSYIGYMLEHVLNVSTPKIFIVEDVCIDQLHGVSLPEDMSIFVRSKTGASHVARIPNFQALFQVSEPHKSHDWHWDDVGTLLFTSGTTGPSKAVKIPWLQFYQSSVGIWQAQYLDSSVRMYSPWPINHISGAGAAYMVALTGGCLITRERWSTSSFIEDIEKYSCNITTLMAETVGFIHQLDNLERVQLEHIFIGRITEESTQLAERLGAKYCTNFNMTELNSPIGSVGYSPVELGTVGQLREGLEAKIVDDHGRAVEPGVVGELLIRAADEAALNAGYWEMPQATEEAWNGGWFHTGDLMRMDRRGNFSMVGRAKDRIRVRGENVSPDEVESVMQQFHGIRRCSAVGRPSTVPGEDEIVLFVEPRDAFCSSDIHAYAEKHLPKFMRPTLIVEADTFPMTPTGKIQRKTLLDSID